MAFTVSAALSHVGREALRMVLPAPCVSCGEELSWRRRVASCCERCWTRMPVIAGARCRSCALPLNTANDLLCLSCTREPLPLVWCEAWGEYRGSLERVLHAFKFQRHDFFDRPLAGLILERIATRDEIVFDAVVPIPMTARKRRQRGYNQAELLARAVSKHMAVPCRPARLVRREERQTQATLARAERAANVRGVFAASEVEGKTILLIDDICTTGETLRAASRALSDAGAVRVAAAVVAKTL